MFSDGVAQPEPALLDAVGCMSGTSLDGLDAAHVRLHTDAQGQPTQAELVRLVQRPFPSDLVLALRNLAEGQPTEPVKVLRAARQLGELHADLCAEVMDGSPADFIAAHGQTVWHAPDDPAGRLSWQLLDPWPIVHRLGCAVVYDFRQADLIAGGEGAPITPIADPVLYSDRVSHPDAFAVVNLGGIANLAAIQRVEAKQAIAAGDVGPCGILLDGLAQRLLDQPMDRDGGIAASGAADAEAVQALASRIDAALAGAKTMGREQFPAAWLDALVREVLRGLAVPDALASAVEAVAARVVDSVRQTGVSSVVLAGGNASNGHLVRVMQRLGAEVGAWATSDSLGIPNQAREPMAMAVLGALSRAGLPGTLSAVTGATQPGPLGAWVHPRQSSTKPEALEPKPVQPFAEVRAGRGGLMTERRLPESAGLDAMGTAEILATINGQDQRIAPAVRRAIPTMTELVDRVVQGMADGGRLIYFGAGTSGRLGVLDASECPPTYHTDPSEVVGIIAGGDGALRKSSEGMEDDPQGVEPEFDRINLGPADTAVGIAAGGTTPYVLGGLALAKARGAATALIACVDLGDLAQRVDLSAVDHCVALMVGPEVVTGSTRMKAGSATKLALNMITTAAMVRRGKVWGNLMVDLKASNVKLRDRALRILTGQTDASAEQAALALDLAGGRVKPALLMLRLGLSLAQADAKLLDSDGRLGPILGPPR